MAEQKAVPDSKVTLQAMTQENIAPQLPPGQQRTRPMGLLETMYHKYNCQEIDVCPMFFRIFCTYPVRRQHINQALVRVTEQFSALRLTIAETGKNSYKFVEKKHMPITIHELYLQGAVPELDSECHHRFDFLNGPLWKFTWLKSALVSLEQGDTFPFQFQFFFTFHHAIADFNLSRLIIRRFLENVLHSQGILSHCSSQRIQLSPCIEHVIPLNLVGKHTHYKGRNAYGPTQAIDLYNANFCSEIQLLTKEEPSTKMGCWRLTEEDTALFLKQCKMHNIKITSALTAACTLSFVQLIRNEIPEKTKNLIVPTEIIVDLRRYAMDDGARQPLGSVGAVHMPFLVDVDVSKDISCRSLFWNIAKQCQIKLDKDLAKGEPMRILKDDIPLEIQNSENSPKGKSPYVLTLTNLSCIDDLVPHQYNDVMQLDEFIPWSNVSIDDMPIFYTGIYTINKRLSLATGYSSNYTSQQTAAKFSWSVIGYLKTASKL